MSFSKYVFNTILNQVVVTVLNFIGGIIIARELGPSGVGLYTLILLLPQIAFRFGNLGLGASFSYFIGKNRIDLNAITGFAVVSALVLATVSLILMYLYNNFKLSPWYNIDSQLILFGFILVPLQFLNNFLERIVSGMLRIVPRNAINTGSSFVFIFFIILFLFLNQISLITVLICKLLADSIKLLGFLYISKAFSLVRNLHVIKIEDVRRLYSFGKYNYLLMLSNFLLDQIPILSLPMFGISAGQIGVFAKGKGLAGQIKVLVLPFSNILFPVNTVSSEEKNILRTNQISRFFFTVMLILMLFIAPFVEDIIIKLYGVDFQESALVFYILIPFIVFYPSSQFLGVHLAASGQVRRIALQGIGVLILYPFLLFYLVNKYGINGAAFSLTIMTLATFILRVRVFLRQTHSTLTSILFLKRKDIFLLVKYIRK